MTIPQAYVNEYLESDNTYIMEEQPKTAVDISKYMLFKFAATSLVSPFEVARILLQVQYKYVTGDPEEKEESNFSEETDDFESKLSSYDTYLRAATTSRRHHTINEVLPTDSMGYIDDDVQVKSQSMLPCLKKKGTLGTIKIIHRYNGFSSLWQGLSSLWLQSLLVDTMEELADGIVKNTFDIDSSSTEFPWTVGTVAYVVPRIAIGILLLPLEVIKTRLVVQAVLKHEKKYTGLLDALQKIKKEEGLSVLYQCPLIASIEYGLSAVCKYVPTLLLSQYLETDSASVLGSLMYVGARLLCQTSYLLVAMPCEVIRRRLYVQYAPKNPLLQTKSAFLTRVNISPVKYTGAWNALRRIIREEGVSTFYQGMSLYLVTNAINSLSLVFNVWMYFEENLAEESDQIV